MNCLFLLLAVLHSSYGQAALTTTAPCTLPCPAGQKCSVAATGAQHCVNDTSAGCNLLCHVGEQCVLTQLGAQCVSTVDGNGQSSVCGPNESLNQCGNLCEQKCQYAGSNGRVCPMVCGPPACACSNGFYRHEQTNKCVPRVMCQSVDSWPNAQQWGSSNFPRNSYPGVNFPPSSGFPNIGSQYPGSFSGSNYPGFPNSNWNQGANYPGNFPGSSFPGPGNTNSFLGYGNPSGSNPGYPLSYYAGLSGSNPPSTANWASPYDGNPGSGSDYQGSNPYN